MSSVTKPGRVSVPSQWIVAFTGHRRLPDEATVAAAIGRQLSWLQLKAAGNGGSVVAETSIAAGGDTIFVEKTVALGIPWVALLPMVEGEFRTDLAEAEWRRASDCLAHAVEVVVCSPETRPEVLKKPDLRAYAYLEAGLRMVDEADLLLAVWDGEPARGRGGTAEIVDYARSQGKPVLWICSKTGDVKENGWDSFPFRDPLMAELHALPSNKAASASSLPTQSADPGRDDLFDLFERADSAAVTKGGSYRLSMIWMLVLQSGAVVLAPAVLTQGFISPPFVLSALFCVLGALAMLVILSLKRSQHRQARFRFAAELCRSAHAIWLCPLDLSEVWEPAVPEFNRLLISLRLARIGYGAELSRNTTQVDGISQLEMFKTSYETERLQNQARYFRKQLFRAKKQGRIEPVAMICSCGTSLLLIVLFGGILAGYRTLLDSWLLYIPALAPVVASTLISLSILFDVKRRKSRYDAMLELIESAIARLHLAQSPEAVRRIVEPVERALLAEAREWYYQAMHSTGM